MKILRPLIVVASIEVSKNFYESLMGLRIEREFPDYLSFEEGPAVQTRESFASEIDVSEKTVLMRPHNMELYFEERNFDEFLNRLKEHEVELLHPVIEQSWGQKVVRFYDPDMHIIEVGESMDVVIKNCLNCGLSVDETVRKTAYPEKVVQKCLREITKRRR